MTANLSVDAPKKESPFKSVLLLMSGRGLAFLATFFIPVVLARIFDPAQFGTYKQLFLVQSTVFFMTQLGMATSLYYFLPSAALEAGRYVANSLVFLGLAGVAGFGFLTLAAPQLGRSMNNPSLIKYFPMMGLFLLLMMLSASLEIVLIARGRYLWASISYGLSDLIRAAVFILPVIFFRQLDWLLKGAVVLGTIRAIVTLVYFRSEFGGNFRIDMSLMRRQLIYALPLGAAVLVDIMQGSLPPYLVSWFSDPVTFAIFAVGCLQIPLVDLAASPASDVMMVSMQKSLAEGDKRTMLDTWHETTWKLALLFFPLTALVMAAGHEIIVMLFTRKYEASVPLFIVWSLIVLLSTLQVDGVLRVFAQTRFILLLNLLRLAIVGGLIAASLRIFHLLGPVLVMVLATVTFKVLALGRMRKLLEVTAARLLPWGELGTILGASVAAAATALVVRSQMHGSLIAILIAMSATHAVVYCFIVWYFNLLHDSERSAIASWVHKTTARFADARAEG